jgi:hypothetical protein
VALRCSDLLATVLVACSPTMKVGEPRMNEIPRSRGKKTLGSKLASTVLVFVGPLLLLAIVGIFSGSEDIGTPEILLLELMWAVGLVWVWWPRRS